MNGDESARYCAFCGLPIPSSFSLSRQHSPDEIDYCCSGCRAVASVDRATLEQGHSAHSMLRLGLAVFFTMNVMVFTMALWSQDIYPDQSFTSELALVLRSVFRWASLVFSLPVLFLLGEPLLRDSWETLRRGRLSAELAGELPSQAGDLGEKLARVNGDSNRSRLVGRRARHRLTDPP